MPGSPIERSSRVYVAGHQGLVGSAVWRHLDSQGFTDVVGRTSAELDLRERQATFAFLEEQKPDVVVLAAARGGRDPRQQHPAGGLPFRQPAGPTECAGRRRAAQGAAAALPGLELHLPAAGRPADPRGLPAQRAHLEPTNDAYAIATIAGILHTQALRRQYGQHYISAMPTNLYGPEDNFDLETSHVLPAMIRRLHEAKESGAASVTMWGSGSPRREFLHADDLGRAVVFLLQHYDDPQHVNVGVGEDVTVKELAETDRRLGRVLRGRAPMGPLEARRHPSQAARRRHDPRARVEGRDRPRRRHTVDIRVVLAAAAVRHTARERGE